MIKVETQIERLDRAEAALLVIIQHQLTGVRTREDQAVLADAATQILQERRSRARDKCSASATPQRVEESGMEELRLVWDPEEQTVEIEPKGFALDIGPLRKRDDGKLEAVLRFRSPITVKDVGGPES